jgi:peptide/nickel transport system substrate-binding protein
MGLQQVASLLTFEGLVLTGRNGRSTPLLAREVTTSQDGRVLRIQLRPSVTFHDGTPVNAQSVKTALESALKSFGPIAKDIAGIHVLSDLTLELELDRRSNFLAEGLDFQIRSPSDRNAGTGPFRKTTASGNLVEMAANRQYYLGAPLIDRVVIKPYDRLRSAWADMLRGQIDMLYEIGVEGLDSLQPASNVRIFLHKRPYAYLVIFNMRRPELLPAEVRRALNLAVNRSQIVAEGFGGHGAPTDGPLPPDHWAYNTSFQHFTYDPAGATASLRRAGRPIVQFTCITPGEQPYERLALIVQRQLRAAGIEMKIEPVTYEQFTPRLQSGDFQAVLADFHIAPSLFNQYQFWYAEGPRNLGGFRSGSVDGALERIWRAPNDEMYRAGVEAFQSAIINDPPAIFLSWSERARAVSNRFQPPPELGRELSSISAIRLFKPITDERSIGRN